MEYQERKNYEKAYHKLIIKNMDLIEKEIGEKAEKITREGYQKIPEVVVLPMMDKSLFGEVIKTNVAFIAFYKAMREQGYEVEKSIRIFYRISDRIFAKMPKFIRKLIGYSMTSKMALKKFVAYGEKTQLKAYSGEFVMKAGALKNGRGYYLESEECAVRKLYKANAIEELIQYCSFFDYIQARACNLGVRHTHNGDCPQLYCLMEVDYKGKVVMRPELKDIVDDIPLKSAID